VIQLTPLLGYTMHLQSMLRIRFSTLPAYPTNACRCWKRLGPFPTLSCSTGPLLQASGRDPASALPPGVPLFRGTVLVHAVSVGKYPGDRGANRQSDTHTHTHTNSPKHGLQSALHPHTVRLLTEGDDTRVCGDTIDPPDDEQRAARNMLRSVV